jgi:hypothetical protein
MTPEPPPVVVEGVGALLSDGTFVPEADIRAAAELVAELCRLIENLPPDVRVQLEAGAVVDKAWRER